MKPIRVLHTEWSDGWGGQEIRVITEMLSLRKRGIEPYLACREHAKIKAKAISVGIPVFVVPFDGIADLRTVWMLFKIIKKLRIDIVNTHSGKDTWTGGIAAKLTGAKFIRTRHLSNKINPSRLNFINELADAVITTGEQIRKEMIKHNRIKSDKIVSIPTGANEAVFDPSKYDKRENRKLFGIKDDKIAIGILAVLRKFKRHDLFVEMACEVSKQFPETVFLIAGDGPQKENIKRLIEAKNLQKQIKMLGHINEPAKFLSALDLFVLTSDSGEGVPQAIIQALMMRLPVVTTDVGSVGDLHCEDNFILISRNNTDSLVANVKHLIKDKRLRQKYSERARNYIMKNFSETVMTDRLLHLYNLILKK